MGELDFTKFIRNGWGSHLMSQVLRTDISLASTEH